ncbi:MAG: DUF47 family protein [Candidatus Lokiarchaeota archaeon]|nr:DUF47 family protein [Candidatus Lokiarchaeota archaeon]
MKGKNIRKIDDVSKNYYIELLKGAKLIHQICIDFTKKTIKKKDLDAVIECESKCDRIKEEYIEILFKNKRALPFLVEDRYKIIGFVDQVLGRIEYFSRFLKIYPFALDNNIKNQFKDLSDINLKVIEIMVETLNLIENNFDDAYKMTFTIQSMRRDAREIRFEILGIIYKNDDAKKVFLTSQLVNNLYHIIGIVEDIADYLRGLIIKYPSR